MTISKVAQHILSVLVDAIEEEILKLCLIGESACLLVSHLLDLLLLLIKLGLHADDLLFLVVIVGFEECYDLLSNALLLHVLVLHLLDDRGNERSIHVIVLQVKVLIDSSRLIASHFLELTILLFGLWKRP